MWHRFNDVVAQLIAEKCRSREGGWEWGKLYSRSKIMLCDGMLVSRWFLRNSQHDFIVSVTEMLTNRCLYFMIAHFIAVSSIDTVRRTKKFRPLRLRPV